MRSLQTYLLSLFLFSFGCQFMHGSKSGAWQFVAPREEVKPVHFLEDDGKLCIQAEEREGLMGNWSREYPVQGGKVYQFSASCVTRGMANPRREAIARIFWLGKEGRKVNRKTAPTTIVLYRGTAKAEPEFPVATSETIAGKVHARELHGTYEAPPEAVVARVELHFRWGAKHSSVTWSDVKLHEVAQKQERKIKLGAVHYQPRSGTSRQEKCELFAPFIEAAGKQGVDLLVLPESLTYYKSGRSLADCAEPIPGPSSQYFGTLAQEHQLYIVAGLVERDGHSVYNTAVLLGPDGGLVGKYRKVTLPRGEIEAGLRPGSKLPVFDTSFGKVGMMICYDGFFPEVARGLTNNGAEVIAWPVWGCNPLLAGARACENHVYVVSSTYSKFENNWMRTAVYGHDGNPLAEAKSFGTLAIAEVDLEQRLHWQSLGDFKAQILPHSPVIEEEKVQNP